MMSGNSRFDASANSPDGSIFTGYSNGQRSHFASSSNLERSSSFREGIDSRMLGGGNVPKGTASTHGDQILLSQVLSQVQSQVATLDSMSVGDAKSTRQLELRKVMNAALGFGSEDPLVQSKSLSSLGLEELKRVRSSLNDNSLKAREKSKIYAEAIGRLEKCRGPLSSRKRSRTEMASNSSLSVDRAAASANLLKPVSQTHQASSSVDPPSQRSEDRKSTIPNKKARTAVDIRQEGRANLARPVILDKEREVLRSGSCLSQSEEKDRAFPAGAKGKRSGIKSDVTVAAMAGRMVEGERDVKRGMQQRTSNEGRPRLTESHSFRSGPLPGMASTHKVENSLNVRAVPRNEHESSTPTSDKRDRSAPEKDRIVVKGTLKQAVREENHTPNTITMPKGKASRAPRSNSGASTNSSPRFLHTSPTLDGWERSSGSNKIQLPGNSNNRKRPLPTRSSSPPVAQWVGQRSTKIARIARTNLVPPVASRDEVPVLTEGSPNLDSVSKPDSTDSNVSGFPRRSSNSNGPQQSKLKSENISSAGLSESEESGAADNKSKEKNKRAAEVEEKVAPIVQKSTSFVLQQKKKVIPKEESSGDGVRRQGRSGRGLAPIKATVQAPSGKPENVGTAKQLRSNRPGSDKGENKSGRPPSKKISSDRKPLTRPRRPMNSGSSDFTGESDDDREELLSAIEAAISASDARCSGPFWKQMEPYFTDLNEENLMLLKKQIRESPDGELVWGCSSLIAQNGKLNGSTGTPPCPNPNVSIKNSLANEGAECDNQNDSHFGDTSSEDYKWFDRIIPLSQRLLSALITEDVKEENMSYENGQHDEFSFGACNQIDKDSKGNEISESELEPDMQMRSRKLYLADNLGYGNQGTPNGYRNNNLENRNGVPNRHEDKIAVHSENEISSQYFGELEDRHLACNSFCIVSSIANTDFQYESMSLDKRIILELHSIGLCPEFVPDLSHTDEEEITEDLSKVQEELNLQVSRNKNQINELEKAISKEREAEIRRREKLAMNKLVEKAYEKHSGIRGTNPSGGKNAGNKMTKQANLAFVKRTLAKCIKFDETGKSCFSEPLLKEKLYSLSTAEPNMNVAGAAIDIGTTNTIFVPVASTADVKTSVAALENATVLGKIENGDQESCDTPSAGVSGPEQTDSKDDYWSAKMKKKELLLEDVGNGLLKGVSPLSGLGGAKGKRSERDSKGQLKEILTRSGAAKGGRPTFGNAKGERKSKSKPRQKTAQLSISVNGLLGKAVDTPKTSCVASGEKSNDKIASSKDNPNSSATESLSNEENGIVDLSHLPLPGVEDFDAISGQGQDLSTWLTIDDEIDNTDDIMGLDVPMDDLSELELVQ